VPLKIKVTHSTAGIIEKINIHVANNTKILTLILNKPANIIVW
jgi:hypothetical protein